MHIDLSGRRAIVSGSTDGIGLAAAIGLAKAGAAVVVNGRADDTTAQAAERVRSAAPGARVDPVAGDLSTAAGVDGFIAAAGEADILVNNLGVFRMGPFAETADAVWSELFDANVMSGVRLSRHYFPAMLKKNWGRVIFTSSESGLSPSTDAIAYAMTKSAQLAISRGLAELTAGTGVTVNSILPGPTKTRGLTGLMKMVSEKEGISEEAAERAFIARARPSSIIGRFARPEEVANLVVYLASEQASATNGAALRVEGGIVRTIA